VRTIREEEIFKNGLWNMDGGRADHGEDGVALPEAVDIIVSLKEKLSRLKMNLKEIMDSRRHLPAVAF
jgi:hypothetical protein